ncbi:MAG: DUF1549 domain-containing protein [Verrucomicrobiia bacterium]
MKYATSPSLRSSLKWATPLLIAAFATFTTSTAIAEKADAPKGLKTFTERFQSKTAPEKPSFRRHVVPLMSRSGCSGRECHGSFSGQGGFQLSLFGYDFEKDHKAITQDDEGNEGEIRTRVDDPLNSLILTKPTMQVKHRGKERIKKDSWEYNLILKWIQGGAKFDLEETGQFDRLEVFPREIVFGKAGAKTQLKVFAYWKDGTVENVTQITRFRTNDESVAEVDEHGVVTSLNKGDTHIVAFYDNGVHPIPVMLPVSDKIGRNYPQVATRTKVDKLIGEKLKKVGIVPSEVCTDLEFFRRVSIDLTGTLPTPKQVKAFQSDSSANKRQKKIEDLLESPGYAAWWTTRLCDITGNNARNITDRNFRTQMGRQWYDWIYKRVAENAPYDELAAGIVLGKSRDKGESYLDYATEMSSYLKKDNPHDFAERDSMPWYWSRRNVRKPEEKALAFSHSFLGVRIQCAQCHKHPFDQWTQKDFTQFQAFFDRVGYGTDKSQRDDTGYRDLTTEINEAVGYTKKKNNKKDTYAEIKRRASRGEPVPIQEVYISAPRSNKKLTKAQLAKIKKRNPKAGGRVITPKLLGGEEVMDSEYDDPRAPLMEWLRSPENPYFARAFVNRVWENYFGRGIVAPADDMNLANPPSNRALLDYLATTFAAKGYDMKWLHNEILNSDAYQRSWKVTDSNRLDEKNFSRMVLRRIPAEVVNDAITLATGSPALAEQMISNMDMRSIGGAAATGYGNKKGGSSYALSIFGKPVRETTCDCERSNAPTLIQTLYVRNDQDVWNRLGGGKNGWIGELERAEGKKSSKSGANKKIQGRLKRLEQQEKALQKRRPEKFDDDATPQQKKRYKAAMASYRKQATNLKNERKRLDDYTGKNANPAATPKVAMNPDKLIEEVFLRTVSRPPSNAELEVARADMSKADSVSGGVRELLWAMLNTKEFMINH